MKKKAWKSACGLAYSLFTFCPSAIAIENTPFVGDLLEFDCGARMAALGTAALVEPGAVAAANYNPAVLSQVQGREVLIMHAEQFASQGQFDLAGFSLHLRPGLGTAILVSRSAVDGILDTRAAEQDANGNPIPVAFPLLSASDYVMTLGLGKDMGHGIHLGGSVRGFYRTLYEGFTGYGAAADASLQWQPRSAWALAFVVRNATTAYTTWNSGTDETEYPSAYLGAGHTMQAPYFYGSFSLYFRTCSLLPFGSLENWGEDPSLVDVKEDPLQIFRSGSAGIEYRFRRIFWLRGGIRSGVQYSGGAGLALREDGLRNAALAKILKRWGIREVGLDYAYRTDPELYESHLLSLRAGF